MSFREETIADAVARMNEINAQLRKLTDERCEIYDVLNALQYKPGPVKITVVGGVKFTTRKKPAQASKPRSEEKSETVEFVLYGKMHNLKKPVLKTLLSLSTFCNAKVVAQVRKWHKPRTKRSAQTIAKFYIRYLLENNFIEKARRKGRLVRWKVKKDRRGSLAALVEGL